MKFLPAFIIALMLCTAPALAAVKTGTPAPDVSFSDINGNPHKISDFKGHPVVLEWHNPDCPFVRKFYESATMQKLQTDATRERVTWITINSSAEGEQGYFKDDAIARMYRDQIHMASSMYVRDPSGEIGRRFGAKTTPHMFVIDKNGKIAYQGAIDSIKSTNPEDISKAENYITNSLAALKDGKKVLPAATEAYGCSVKYSK